jgi:hypothetical protein
MDGSSSSSSSGGHASASPLSPIAASTSSSMRRTYTLGISGDQLRFDWAWIAAGRQVIELNLRDLHNLLMGHLQGVLVRSPVSRSSSHAPRRGSRLVRWAWMAVAQVDWRSRVEKGGLVWRDNGGASRAFRPWDVTALC